MNLFQLFIRVVVLFGPITFLGDGIPVDMLVHLFDIESRQLLALELKGAAFICEPLVGNSSVSLLAPKFLCLFVHFNIAACPRVKWFTFVILVPFNPSPCNLDGQLSNLGTDVLDEIIGWLLQGGLPILRDSLHGCFTVKSNFNGTLLNVVKSTSKG